MKPIAIFDIAVLMVGIFVLALQSQVVDRLDQWILRLEESENKP
jgi:hypothetical protein